MAFTITDLHDLMQLLEVHPEWQAELRRVLVPEDLRALPPLFERLMMAQRRTEEALTRLAEHLEKISTESAAAQERIWTEMRQSNARTDQRLAEAAAERERVWAEIRKTDERIESIWAEIRKTDERIESIWAEIRKIDDRIDKSNERIERTLDRIETMQKYLGPMRGLIKEQFYRDRAAAIFGRFLTKGRDVTAQVADQLYAAFRAGRISEHDLNDVLAADLLWCGQLRDQEYEVVLVLEASWLVEKSDVERAVRRARLLRQVGLKAMPVAAGEVWGEGVKSMARLQAVVITEDGRVDGASWQDALEQALQH